MKYVPGNAQHLGSRKEQQDSFGFSDPNEEGFVSHGGFLAVLADGMGGLDHGRAASSLAVKTFLDAYHCKTEQEEIPLALERAALEANAAVWSLAEQAGSEGNVGTTLVAAAFDQNSLHWISVGDSALYLFRDESLSLLTTSHIYANELDEKAATGSISHETALNDPQREALTSYLGIRELQEMDRSTEPFLLLAGDRIVLCSDGLFKTLTTPELSAELSADPQQACEALVQKTLEKGLDHQDNITVLCVGIEKEKEVAVPSPPSRTARNRVRLWGVLSILLLVVIGIASWWYLSGWFQ